jgi:hypothetical protein
VIGGAAATPAAEPGPEAAAPREPGRPARRRSWRTPATAAFVTTLSRPSSWAFGLLGFLAGGGLVIVAWPILVLPTPTGLQNDLGGPVNRLVLGTSTTERVLLAGAGVLAVIVVVVAATLVGAWAERRGIALALEAAGEEGLATPSADLDAAPGVGRVALIRLLSLVPVGIALAIAWGPLYDAGYRELILPDDLVTPLPIRVLRDVPGLVTLVAVAWLVSDAAAAVAVRRLLFDRRSVRSAWGLGWVALVRHPLRVLAAAGIGILSMILLAGPPLLASAAGWTRVRDAMLQGRDGPEMLVIVAIWVATWLGTLVLAGVAAAVRAAAWTFAVDPGRHAGGAGRV